MLNIRIIALAIAVVTAINIRAQEFNKHFTDRTLRLDYIFSGNKATRRART